MFTKYLKSKIHRARITDANLDYEGSISIDSTLMKAANFSLYEKVHVLDITNGNRIETYVINAQSDSGEICINGAAAHLIKPNDKVIIISYCSLDENETHDFKPTIVKVNDNNKIIR